MAIRHGIKAVLLDMDGVLYHGDHVIPSAIAFMQHLANIPHVFITNNPILTAAGIADKLTNLGFNRPSIDSILTSGHATAIWLNEKIPNFRYYTVGAKGLDQALAQYGRKDQQNADVVVVGEGAGLDYHSLATGINLIMQNNARLIATNPDVTVDAMRNGKHWILPGGGALLAPFEAATGVTATIIGKPQPLLYQMAMNRLSVKAEHCLMIGDRPDTDIDGAARLNIQTALVRTGRFNPQAKWPDNIVKADWDVNSLDELAELIF